MIRPGAALLALIMLAGIARADAVPDWVTLASSRVTPAWAHDAGAVVLDDERTVTVAGAGRVVEDDRHVLRVLSVAALSGVAGSASYVRGMGEIRTIEAWQIDPDGHVRHLGRRDVVDLSAVGPWTLYSDLREQVLEGVSPRVGTVFAFESVSEDRPLFASWIWHFDDDQPVLHSSLTLELPGGLEPVTHPGAGKSVEAVRAGSAWRWETNDLPARAHEPAAPEPCDAGACVFVTLRPAAGHPADPGIAGATFASWADVARWLDGIGAPQAVAGPGLAERLRVTTGTIADSLTRIRLLAREVQRTRYVADDIGLGHGWGYRPHPAEQVLALGYGDCKDKANLLCTLLRLDGHRAYMVSLYSGNRERVIADWPSPDQFNHCIVAIGVPRGTALPAVIDHPTLGALLLFDPTDPYTTLGDLPTDEQGALALIDDPAASTLTRMPVAPPETRLHERVVDAALSGDGVLTARMLERMHGQAAVDDRASHDAMTGSAYRAQIEAWLAADGASIDLERVDTSEDSLAGSFTIDARFSAPLFARNVAGSMLTFRPDLASRRVISVLSDSARTQPIIVPAECFVESVTVRLPEGYRVDDLPATVDQKNDFGTLHAEWRVEGDALRFIRRQRVELTRVPAARYREVRSFYALESHVQNMAVVLVRR